MKDYGGEDNPLARQELFGEFVNLQAGAIYWGFDRNIHLADLKLDKNYPVFVCQDFNIENMCNIYMQKINGHYLIVKENRLTHRNANTDDTSKKIIEDLKGFEYSVIPDSTGGSRKTSAKGNALSDIQILESYGIKVLYTKNPLIRDRQNALNIAFKKNIITIDRNCKNLINEIETLSSRDNEGSVSHLAVALGYGVWYFDPLYRDYGKSTSIQL